MVDTQHNEEETANPPGQPPVQEVANNPNPAIENPTLNPDHQNPALNPTVELTRVETDSMIEYIRTSSNIGLDWYVPDLNNTCGRDMIKNRLSTRTGRNHITVTRPMLKEFFTTSTFEINLSSG